MLTTKRGLFAALAATMFVGASAHALTFQWDASDLTSTWADADNWTITNGSLPGGHTQAWPGGDGRQGDIVVIANATPRPAVNTSYQFASLELLPSSKMTFSDANADVTVTGNVMLRNASELELTNVGNRLIMPASSQIVVDADGGGASSAAISGVGEVYLNQGSASISIPNASSDVLTLTDATIMGRGTITGSGLLNNFGFVQARDAGSLILDVNLNLVDDDAVRWSAINTSSQMVFKKSHTAGGSNELLGTFEIGDSSSAKFTLDSCNVETAGEFYIDGIAQATADGCGGGAQGNNTWRFYYWDYSVPEQVITCHN